MLYYYTNNIKLTLDLFQIYFINTENPSLKKVYIFIFSEAGTVQSLNQVLALVQYLIFYF